MDSEMNDVKRTIGKLIKFYRRKRKIKAKAFIYNKGAFYDAYCTNCDRCNNKHIITSDKTLRKLESGGITSNDCIYIRLAENIGRKICFDRTVYDHYRRLRHKVIDALTTNKQSNLKETMEGCLYFEKLCKDYLYLQEMSSVFVEVIAYRLENKIANDERLLTYFQYRRVFDAEDVKVIYFYLLEVCRRTLVLRCHYDDLLLEIGDWIDEKLFFSIKINNLLQNGYSHGLDRLKEIEQDECDYLEEYQKYILYGRIAQSYLNLNDLGSALLYVDKCRTIIDGYDLSDWIKHNNTVQVGMINYRMGRYSKASEFFLEVFGLDMNAIGSNVLLMFDAMRRVHDHVDISKVVKDIDIRSLNNRNAKIITRYYKLRYGDKMISKEGARKLEDYIIDVLFPICKVYGELAVNIFEDELHELIDITGDYKKLLIYRKMAKMF